MKRRVLVVGQGLLLGLAWGVAARLWMRFISTDPEFSWSGTGFIVGAATIAGTASGIVRAARRSWVKGLGVAAFLPLGMGAGMLTLPTIMFGTLATRRRTLPSAARVLLGVVAAIPLAFVVGGILQEGFGVIRASLAVLWYVGLCAWMIAIAGVSIGSTRLPGPLGAAEREDDLVPEKL